MVLVGAPPEPQPGTKRLDRLHLVEKIRQVTGFWRRRGAIRGRSGCRTHAVNTQPHRQRERAPGAPRLRIATARSVAPAGPREPACPSSQGTTHAASGFFKSADQPQSRGVPWLDHPIRDSLRKLWHTQLDQPSLEQPRGEGQEHRRYERQEKPQDPSHDGGGRPDAFKLPRRGPSRAPSRCANRQIGASALHGCRLCGSGLGRDGVIGGLCTCSVNGHDLESSLFPPGNVRRASAEDSRNRHSHYNKYKIPTVAIRNANG